MADDIIELHPTHIKDGLKYHVDAARAGKLTTIAVVSIDKDGNVAGSFAHDGEPDPYRLLGGLSEMERTVLDWMADQE